MPGSADVLKTAKAEADVAVSWRYHKSRVFEYIRLSRNKTYVANDPKDQSNSWCGDFLYWVLAMSGVSPLPVPVYCGAHAKSNAISRYVDVYDETNNPQPGDMYYMPKNKAGVAKHHVGIIVDASDMSAIQTIDGNTDGGLGGDLGQLVKGIGGGYVTYNTRYPTETPLRFFSIPYDGCEG